LRLLDFVAALAALALAAAGGLFALAAYYPERLEELLLVVQSTAGRGSNDAPEVSTGPGASLTASDTSAVDAGAIPAEPPPPPRPPLPSSDRMVILIRSSLTALNQANVSANYSVLRELAAPQFQEVNSSARLSEVFTPLRSRNLDLSAVEVLNPNLTETPFIDNDGRLNLTGYFPSRPHEILFDLVFEFEDGWRLFGIAVDTRPAEVAEAAEGTAPGPAVTDRPPPPEKLPEPDRRPPVPDNETVVALIRDVVVALGQANATGNYSVLLEIAAPGFQEVNSHAKLMEIFGDLRRRNLDLGPVTVIQPALTKPPAIDDRGWLRLAGGFPTRPEQVNFDLAFQKIAGEWKLFGIGLNTSRLVAGPAEAGSGSTSVGGPPAESATPPAAGTNSATATPTRGSPPTPRARPLR